MDLETFFTIVYVLVDNWYKEHVACHKSKRPGPKPKMSDSEVLTVALVGQWRIGVPWQSERGLVRYMQAHGKGMFPAMLERSQFNARVRDLWGVFIQLQQDIASWLEGADDVYVCVDSEPIPAFSNGQALHEKTHWLWESTKGRGGTTGGFFVGDHLLAVVARSGAVTGWLLGSANVQDRWLLEALLSARAGKRQIVGPPPNPKRPRSGRPTPPIEHIGPAQAAGDRTGLPYLADKGFNGDRWRDHWQQTYGATVISVPPPNSPHLRLWSRRDCRWLASHRQIVDTAFAFLDQVFGMKRINAHSRWGQYTRVAAKIASYNLGLLINRSLRRPAGALATLLC